MKKGSPDDKSPMEASPSSRGPTEPKIIIFIPLGGNEDYVVPDLEDVGAQTPQFLQAPSIQALVRGPTSLPTMIQGLEIILRERFSTAPRPGEAKIYLPGCILPIRYQFRIQILIKNLQSAPKLLALAVATKSWNVCREIIRDRLVPSYLQTRLGIDAVWPDSHTHRGAIECEQTCWTALWHVLTTKRLMAKLEEVVPAHRAQRFRTHIDLILAQLIIACGGPIVQGDPRDHGPTFELKFHLEMMDVAIAWRMAHNQRRAGMALGRSTSHGV